MKKIFFDVVFRFNIKLVMHGTANKKKIYEQKRS